MAVLDRGNRLVSLGCSRVYFKSNRFFGLEDGVICESCPGSKYLSASIIWSTADYEENKLHGLQLNFFDAQYFAYTANDPYEFDADLPPVIEAESDGSWSVKIPSAGILITAREIWFKCLGEDYLGPDSRIGYEIAEDDVEDAVALGGAWRQCSYCSDAWEENPHVNISRCPSCSQLTRLVASEAPESGKASE